MISNLIRTIFCFSMIILVSCSMLTAQSFRVFGVSDVVRVFEDGYKLPDTKDTIIIFGIRGEVISGQCVINSRKNLSNVTVELSEIKNLDTGNLLVEKAVNWNFVGSVPLTTNTTNQPPAALTRSAPANYPEYLMNENQISITKGSYQSVWLTVNIPHNAEAGLYAGNVSVKSLEGEQSLPLTLTVYPLTLPEERNINIVEWYSTEGFERYHGIKEKYSEAWFSMLETYAENLVSHRQNTFRVNMNTIEIAVPKLDALNSWYDSYRKWQQEGNELWFYKVGIYQGSYLLNKTIDMPLIDSRIMHWLNYKYDAIGYLHWGWNQWEGNPYTEAGMHFGDAWHVYPVKEDVLNSLRWEQMRNGIQDYEYFRMLEDRISTLKDSLGSRFAWMDPLQRSKEIAGKVIINIEEHSDDPEILYNAKKEVIKELLELDTSPEVYVQTNPLVNTAMPNHSSVEVYGWTEPGTKIVVNGQELSVSREGLFLEQFSLSPESNKIVVKASNAMGTKEITKEFVIFD